MSITVSEMFTLCTILFLLVQNIVSESIRQFYCSPWPDRFNVWLYFCTVSCWVLAVGVHRFLCCGLRLIILLFLLYSTPSLDNNVSSCPSLVCTVYGSGSNLGASFPVFLVFFNRTLSPGASSFNLIQSVNYANRVISTSILTYLYILRVRDWCECFTGK